MTDFLTLPAERPLRLANLRCPAALSASAASGLAAVDLTLGADGRLTDAPAAAAVDLAGRIVLPAFVDMHTHLDKGHIWPRRPNPDGTFNGALTSVAEDRAANWTADDVRARMEFSLRCALAHGTRAIRTHLDSLPPQDTITWPVFREVRAAWADRIDLQAVSLISGDRIFEPYFVDIADVVADSGGVLGAVTYPMADLDARLDRLFEVAGARNLSVDFHVDETMDPASRTLEAIASAAMRTGFDAPVVAGHCCSLSTQPEAEALAALDTVAKAGLAVVSLPMCNLYLQDRQPGRTPRRRGVTLVHEMAARGIPVSFASDNTRDPFYAYGDMDMLEVFRQATRIAHLDHAGDRWPLSVTATPAVACGFAPPCLKPSSPADLVVFNARDWTELFARPQSDRIVIRGGQPIDRTLPDYAELDHLME